MCRKEHPKMPQKVRLCKFVPHFQNKIKILCYFYFFASEKHFFMLFFCVFLLIIFFPGFLSGIHSEFFRSIF